MIQGSFRLSQICALTSTVVGLSRVPTNRVRIRGRAEFWQNRVELQALQNHMVSSLPVSVGRVRVEALPAVMVNASAGTWAQVLKALEDSRWHSWQWQV